MPALAWEAWGLGVCCSVEPGTSSHKVHKTGAPADLPRMLPAYRALMCATFYHLYTALREVPS